MGRLARFFHLSFYDQRLTLEALFCLTGARLVIKLKSGAQVMRWLSRERGTQYDPNESQLRCAQRIGAAIRRVAPHVPFRSLCLEQAVAGSWMLASRGIPARLSFGARMVDGKLKAHAWLRCGECWLTGAKGVEEFGELASYNK